MSRPMPPVLRRTLGMGTVILSVLAGVVVMTTPAQASPEGCAQTPARGYYVDGEQNIHAYNFWPCYEGPDIPLQLTIRRYVSPGVWTLVASGSGWIDYYCNGHAYNVYNAAGYEFANTCG